MVTAEFVKKGFQEIVHHWLATGLFASVFSLYWVLFLYRVKYEGEQFENITKDFIKSLFIFYIALNWDFFYIIGYRVATDYPLQISEIIVNTIKSSVGGNDNLTLAHLYDTGMNMAFTVLHSMGYSPSSVCLALLGFVLLFSSTLIMCITSLGIIVISKFVLAICLVLAPYFIVMFLFSGTKGLSESWLKFTIGSALTPLFVGIVLALVLVMGDLSLINIKSQTALNSAISAPSYAGIITCFCTSLICLGLLFKTTEMSAAITSSLTQMSMGSVGRRVKMGSDAAKSAYQGSHRKLSSAKNNFRERQSKTMGEVKNRAQERNRLDAIKQASIKRRRNY